MKPPKPDARRSHLFGVFEWRFHPDHVEQLDRRGYRRLFDRTFYDEIETLTVFRETDPFFFFRGLLIALITVPWLLLLRIPFASWTVPLAVAGGTFLIAAGFLFAIAFLRGKTRLRLQTRFGEREIVVNRSEELVRNLVRRLVALARAAQEPAARGESPREGTPAPVGSPESESEPGTASAGRDTPPA